jgi:purine-binding chemotaxis protein CheW
MSKESHQNWSALYQRLALARRGLQEDLGTNPEKERSLLRQRAQELARPLHDELQNLQTTEFLEFRLGQEHYGIESAYVREVLPLKSLTPIPSTPSFLLGIMPVRGEMVAVIDLKPALELPSKGLAEYDKILLLRSRQVEFGILTESVLGIRSLFPSDIQSAPPVFHGIPTDYLRGITQDRMVLLDAAKVLEDPRWIINQQSAD